MRNFMYACIAIAALSFALHCWVQPASAQAPGNPVVAAYQSYVFTANGDAYHLVNTNPDQWAPDGNVFGSPTPAQRATFGQIKAKFAR